MCIVVVAVMLYDDGIWDEIRFDGFLSYLDGTIRIWPTISIVQWESKHNGVGKEGNFSNDSSWLRFSLNECDPRD
jgi:hypothetical protein